MGKEHPMKRSLSRLGISWFFGLLVAPGIACTPSNQVQPGAPVMLSFSVVDPLGAEITLVTEAGSNTVPPLSHFVATFDRLLDPTALEVIDSDGGGITPQAGVGKISWSGGAVDSNALYTPNGHHIFTLIYPKGPSITITPTLGLPSGSTVMVSLDSNKVRSHDQTTPFTPAADVAAILTFDTDPLAATVVVPESVPSDAGSGDDGGADGGADGGPTLVMPPVDPDFVVHIPFNNQTADSTEAQVQVSATVASQPVANLGATIARDDTDPTGWAVTPPASGWPAGATVTVTVGAAAADNFARTLGTAVTATFTVKP
jgi:hypothetical protein